MRNNELGPVTQFWPLKYERGCREIQGKTSLSDERETLSSPFLSLNLLRMVGWRAEVTLALGDATDGHKPNSRCSATGLVACEMTIFPHYRCL